MFDGRKKDDKYLVKKLTKYSAEEALSFSKQKEIYYDYLYTAIEVIKDNLELQDAQAIESLKEEVTRLETLHEKLGDVLTDVIETVEFNID